MANGKGEACRTRGSLQATARKPDVRPLLTRGAVKNVFQ